MISGYKPRTTLNRGDPRLRGTLTWLSLDGHFVNTGNFGGQINIPPSTAGWAPSPLAGTFWAGDATPSSSQITALFTTTLMGVNGSARRTIFFEGCLDPAETNTSGFWIFGGAGSGNFLSVGNYTSGNFGVDAGAGLSITLAITASGQTTTPEFFRAVVRYDGTTLFLDVYSYNPSTRAWTRTSGSVAAALTTATAAGTELAINYFGSTTTPSDVSGLSYLGILGGALWTDAETRAFLVDPSPLWSPAPSKARLYQVPPPPNTTYNDTIADDAAAADSVTATLTTGATVSDAATGADSLSVALTARPTLSDAATAADSSAAAATANASTSDAATSGDASAAALTANAATSDAVTASDAVVGGKSTADTITDTVAGADSLAAALTASPAISDAASGADNQAVALTASAALSDTAAAGDAIAPALTTGATIADAAAAADAVTGAKVTASAITDGATAGEAATVAATFAVTLSDGATAGDGVTGTTGEPITDAVTAGDAIAVSGTFAATITDDAAAGDDVTATGGTPPAPAAGITGGGPLVPMPRRRRWRVRTPGGLLEGFDTPEAAYARFEELYGDPTPATAPSANHARPTPRRISLPAIPARTVALDGADATRSFARLLRDMQAEREAYAAARVQALLDQIATDAARRAAQLEEDDDAAAILLLH